MAEKDGVIPDEEGITQILTPPSSQAEEDTTALDLANRNDRDGTTVVLSSPLKPSEQGEVSPSPDRRREKPVIVHSSSYKPIKIRLHPIIISSTYNAEHLYQHRQKPPAAMAGLAIPPVINYTGKSLEKLVQENMLGTLATCPSSTQDLNLSYQSPPYLTPTTAAQQNGASGPTPSSYYHPSFLSPGSPMVHCYPGQKSSAVSMTNAKPYHIHP